MAHPWQMTCITFVKNMSADTMGESNTLNYLEGICPTLVMLKRKMTINHIKQQLGDYQGASGKKSVPWLRLLQGDVREPAWPGGDGESKVCVTGCGCELGGL